MQNFLNFDEIKSSPIIQSYLKTMKGQENKDILWQHIERELNLFNELCDCITISNPYNDVGNKEVWVLGHLIYGDLCLILKFLNIVPKTKIRADDTILMKESELKDLMMKFREVGFNGSFKFSNKITKPRSIVERG
jgi:hypothetical protein